VEVRLARERPERRVAPRPRRGGAQRRLLDRQPVGVAAVVVRVVDERDAHVGAQREQVGRGEQAVVVLEAQPRAGAVGQRSMPRLSRSSAASGPPVAPPTCSVTVSAPTSSLTTACISSSRTLASSTLGRSELSTTNWSGWNDSRTPSSRAQRPHVGERVLEQPDVGVEVAERVARHRVRGEREHLAVDAERPDAVLVAGLDGLRERLGVVPRDLRQVLAPLVGGEPHHVAVVADRNLMSASRNWQQRPQRIMSGRGCKDRARGAGACRRVYARENGRAGPEPRAPVRACRGVVRGPYWTVTTPFMFMARCGVQW
jgi:hypothetical protein